MRHYPKGVRYSALEKNVLKHRAFEMVLVLFQVQRLRDFVLGSIRATDSIRRSLKGDEPRLPKGAKGATKRAWEILVEDGIITPDESDEIQRLIDYRNIIAHATERVTVDVHREWSGQSALLEQFSEYQPEALDRLEDLARKIEQGMGREYVLELSLDGVIFDPANQTYREEMGRLRKKIHKQARAVQREVDEVNANVASLPRALLEELEPGHPRHMTRSGTLSDEGIDCCYRLFEAGAQPLSAAYLMRLSLRACKSRHDHWIRQRKLIRA